MAILRRRSIGATGPFGSTQVCICGVGSPECAVWAVAVPELLQERAVVLLTMDVGSGHGPPGTSPGPGRTVNPHKDAGSAGGKPPLRVAVMHGVLISNTSRSSRLVEREGTVFANVLHPAAWGVPSAYFVGCGCVCVASRREPHYPAVTPIAVGLAQARSHKALQERQQALALAERPEKLSARKSGET